MTDNPPLSIQAVSKQYHQVPVLKQISFTLKPGEIFGLIGLNGAGKTTLIKIILDLITANGGEVKIFDHSQHSVESRKYLSYLPEKFQPSRYLKGYEFLDLSLSYYGKKLENQAADLMAMKLDLDAKVLSRRVGTYSKGMGQKLGLAAAFLVDSPLLILDEPMSGLDPRARIRLKQVLLDARTSGKTVFFSSHILSDIDEICDRIGIIHEGELRFVGTPAEFKSRHRNDVLEQAFLSLIEPRHPLSA